MKKLVKVILDEEEIKEAIAEKYNVKPYEIELGCVTDDLGNVACIDATYYEN